MKFRTLLFSSILLISMFSITGCTKDDSTETTTERYYAKNEVQEKTTEENSSTSNPIDDIDEESMTTEEPIESLDYKFNVKDDINANENLSFDTISIDGKLISFPCDYNHLKSVFNKLYINKTDDITGEFILEELDETNYTDVSVLELVYKPTTGYGSVKFIIRSIDNSNTNITNCICNEVTISGNNISDEQLMTIALKDNVHFGSTVEDIKNAYGKVTHVYNAYSDDSFVIEYISDESGNEYYFSGKSGGLSNINLTYIIDLDESETTEETIDDEEDDDIYDE